LVASGKAERSIQFSAINCLKEHLTQSHRLFRGSLSDAKVRIYFQFPKYSLGEMLFCLNPNLNLAMILLVLSVCKCDFYSRHMRQVCPHPPVDKEASLFLLCWNLKVLQDLLFLLPHSYGCTQ